MADFIPEAQNPHAIRFRISFVFFLFPSVTDLAQRLNVLLQPITLREQVMIDGPRLYYAPVSLRTAAAIVAAAWAGAGMNSTSPHNGAPFIAA